MNLLIDIGNTSCKLAVFKNAQAIYKKEYKKYSAKNIIDDVQQYSISNCLISDVANSDISFYKEMKEHFNIVDWSLHDLPIKLNYDTKDSLGKDRIAVAVATKHRYPQKNILVVQCGTCITYDCVHKNDGYIGGAISPGIDIRFKALHTFTGKLPLTKIEDIPNIIGKTTKESILSGVFWGIVNEVDSMIEEFKHQLNSDLTVVLTGGHAIFFDKYLKNSNFAVSDLVLEGLNKILEFYVEKTKH